MYTYRMQSIHHFQAPQPPKYPLDDPPLMSFAPNFDDIPKQNFDQNEPDPNAKDIVIEGVSVIFSWFLEILFDMGLF